MRRSLVTGWIALAVTFLSVGCASARIREANTLALARADTRVLEGCYQCLRDARDVYARLAVDKHAPRIAKGAPSIVARLFETEVLLTLREKELALDAHASLDRVRALVPRVPAAMEPRRIVDMIDASLPDGAGTPAKTMDALQERHRPYLQKIEDDLTWIESAPLTPAVRKYVALSLDCSYALRKRPSGDTANTLARRREIPINAPPLVTYRAADCAKTDTLALKRVLYAMPSFHEAGYALAALNVLYAGETGGDEVQRQLDTAHAHFSKAPGVTYLRGYLASLLGDCADANRFYERTLAIEPTHERAMLQMTICQTNMNLDSAAIATATRFIALETSNVAEGYYWRASNRLRRRELDLARSDIDTAKVRSRNDGSVFTLAGIIEHEQNDLGVAEHDLKGARSVWQGDGNCTAAFYLGSVLSKGERYIEAAASFDSAMVCYDGRVRAVALKIEQVRASTMGTAAFRARRIAFLEEELADRRRRYYTSTYNFASMSARIGNIPRAEELLVIAAESPDLTAQVAKLRDLIAEATRQARPAVKEARAVSPPRR
jgi:tetratricopeptide (TPR) repeat protein